ncbi:lipoprotein-releasing ABC transporter permease subunit [Paracoccaceae bacterium]|nr:lipoprotein-releasing ABC transporter permease subunit [Paracoccaceae bacterium]
MDKKAPPFAAYEWTIAWRYLRAKRSEGGVSVMTWISLIGITLAVFALVATLSVRSGFRTEIVDTILGANSHITLYKAPSQDQYGNVTRTFENYDEISSKLISVPGVKRSAPLIRSQIMATYDDRNTGLEVFGISYENLLGLERISNPEKYSGNLNNFKNGIAIGSGVARELGVQVGDKIKLISPNGVRTAFGISPRIKQFTIVYIFTAGRYDIDRTRSYLPFNIAQEYFNREGLADEIEILLDDPSNLTEAITLIENIVGPDTQLWTWRDASSSFLRALEIEDNVMFVLMSILVMIASMNIISGLIMLVKNKGRDIGILRTIGLSKGAIMRVFMICGAFTGIIGTFFGVILGCLFALYIDPIFAVINILSGGGVWDPSIRGIYSVPAELHFIDLVKATCLSLGLSFVVTIIPARRAASLHPVEALRYE